MSLKFFIRTILLGLIFSITNQPTAFGQISSVDDLLQRIREDSNSAKRSNRVKHKCSHGSTSPSLGPRTKMHGDELLAISDDLPFILKADQIVAKAGQKSIYSYFWINADVLNIRSGPGLEHEIVSETYYGNRVSIFAKKGDWVAITKGVKYKNTDVKPTWVHLNYLSADRINQQVDTQVLRDKCSFKTYGELDINKLYSYPHNTYRPCVSVLGYLNNQRWLSGTPHTYWQEYEVWRKSQEFPESYNYPSC